MDYKYIANNLDDKAVIKLLQKLGSEDYIEKPDYIIFKTICHNTDIDNASMKLYYYKQNKRFHCYTECGQMNIFNLLEHYYITNNISYDWFQDIYYVAEKCITNEEIKDFDKNNYNFKKDRYNKNNIANLPTYNKGILNVFIKTYPIEWLNDGISKKAMDKFNILYSITQKKIIIPHYNINNELIGIRGRALDPEEVELYGKYMPIKIEDKWYSHKLSLNLYGLNLNKENIKKTGIVYLVESEKAVMQFESFNCLNCAVATCGSNFNKYQLKLLLKECQPKEIIVCFDKEEFPNEEKYFNKLYSMCKKYSVYCNFSFVYDRENLLNLKDSPTDKGEQIFRKLIEKRVRVK